MENNKIPNILNFVWIGGEFPPWVKHITDEFRKLNPEFEIKFHNETILSDEYKERFQFIPAMDSRSDLLRLSALKKFGGWYFDCDFWPIRPIRDIVSAYALYDGKGFITKQHWHKNQSLIYANGVLAMPPQSLAPDMWRLIDDWIGRIPKEKPNRCDYGPQLFTKLIDKYRDLFIEAEWPYFYPLPKAKARGLYSMIQNGTADPARCRYLTPELKCQVPFVFHLWMGGKTDLSFANKDAKHRVIYTAPDYTHQGRIKPAIVDGLAALGYNVQIEQDYQVGDDADIVWNWNGMKGLSGQIQDRAKESGLITFYLENGFFDRANYYQIDHKGILHHASWMESLKTPAPAGGKQRFLNVWREPLVPQRITGDYILILGQVVGDSQLYGCEMGTAVDLCSLVRQHLPADIPLYFRPHPKHDIRDTERARRYVEILKSKVIHGNTALLESPDLKAAISKARFVVTINSNAGNEALAWGCPVLAMGDSVYTRGGVALRTTKDTFAVDLKRMLDGWKPEQAAVENYLHWLAARQWNLDEIRSGEALKPLIEAAYKTP